MFRLFLGHINLYRVHVKVRLGNDIAFLQVFVNIDFNFNAIACNAADRTSREFLAQKRNINDLLVSAMMSRTKNSIAKHGE